MKRLTTCVFALFCLTSVPVFAAHLDPPLPQAVLNLLAPAKSGDPFSQNELGKAYEEGKWVAPDFAEAMTWYPKAAEQGNPDSPFLLGAYSQSGRGGLPKDEGLAAQWFRRAAAQGDDAAKDILRRFY